MTAQITRSGGFDCQVCVPADWTDAQVREFTNRENPRGTDHGWQIRREGDKALAGEPERVQCDGRPGHVHIMLDA